MSTQPLGVKLYEQVCSAVAGMYGQSISESFLAHDDWRENVFCSKMDVVEEVLNQDR